MAPFTGGQKAPFAGGRIAPGSVVPVNSFFKSPFIFYDQELIYVGNVSARKTLGFVNTFSALMTQVSGGGVSLATIDTLPLQFREGRPVPINDWSVRRIDDFGPNAAPSALGQPDGTWADASTSREWRLPRPAVGTAENLSTYELALSADVSVVLARATVLLRYVRV